MTQLYWPQDFRHLDIIDHDGKRRPSVALRDGFDEFCASKDGKWYEIITLPEGAADSGNVMTPRKVKPLENRELLKLLGSADEWDALMAKQRGDPQ